MITINGAGYRPEVEDVWPIEYNSGNTDYEDVGSIIVSNLAKDHTSDCCNDKVYYIPSAGISRCLKCLQKCNLVENCEDCGGECKKRMANDEVYYTCNDCGNIS